MVIPPASSPLGRGHTGHHLWNQTEGEHCGTRTRTNVEAEGVAYARLRLFDRTALEVEGGVYLHEGGPEFGVMPGDPKEKTWGEVSRGMRIYPGEKERLPGRHPCMTTPRGFRGSIDTDRRHSCFGRGSPSSRC